MKAVLITLSMLVASIAFSKGIGDQTPILEDGMCQCDYELVDAKTYSGSACKDTKKELVVGGGLRVDVDQDITRFHVTCAKLAFKCKCLPTKP